ncbi:MAG: alpha/beta hydrolase [Bacteroidales bacterium]|nr:alpha/beta hydrolase [Bacteroidales bacterium]
MKRRNHNRRWAKGNGLSLQWISAASHSFNVDRPDIVNTAIVNFLKTIWG